MLGSLGDVIFEVSEQRVNTFSDLQFTRSAQYTEHKILGRSGLLEFTGLNAGTCSFSMTFSVQQGTSPKKNIAELERMMNEHEAALFVLDGELVGSGYWVIESLNERAEIIDSFGGIERALVSISLKEYHEA